MKATISLSTGLLEQPPNSSSHFQYCSLQSMLNTSARVILQNLKSDRVTLLFQTLNDTPLYSVKASHYPQDLLFTSLISPPSISSSVSLLLLYWFPCYSSNMTDLPLPQGLCIGSSLQLVFFSLVPDILWYIYTNTMPFYIRDLSILSFWCYLGFWNQSPEVTKGWLYL